MKSLMKKGVMQFLLLCLVAFAHTAKADIRSMFYEDIITTIQYDWNVLNDEITNFQFTLNSNPLVDSLVLNGGVPGLLGDIYFDADGAYGPAEVNFLFANEEQDLITGLYTHYYDLSVYFDDDPDLDRFFDGVEFTEVSAVPVPAALPLMASALGLFGLVKRRRAA